MKDLFKRNYDAVVNRGLIDQDTFPIQFMNKIEEEYKEVLEAYFYKRKDDLAEELGDLMNVCSNYLIFLGYEPINILEQIAEKNEKRKIK